MHLFSSIGRGVGVNNWNNLFLWIRRWRRRPLRNFNVQHPIRGKFANYFFHIHVPRRPAAHILSGHLTSQHSVVILFLFMLGLDDHIVAHGFDNHSILLELLHVQIDVETVFVVHCGTAGAELFMLGGVVHAWPKGEQGCVSTGMGGGDGCDGGGCDGASGLLR